MPAVFNWAGAMAAAGGMLDVIREIAVAGATEPTGYDLRLVSLGDQERDRESQFVRRARRIPWQAQHRAAFCRTVS